MENNNQRQAILPLILCAVFMILARVSGIVYSHLATNVLYSESVICYLLPAVRQILAAVSFAFGAGAAVWNLTRRMKVTVPVIVSGAVLLFDGVAVILYDLIEGSLEGRILFGIVYRTSLFAYSFIMLLAGLWLANMLLKHKKSTALAAITAAALSPAIDLIYVLWNCLDSLIEWEFLPYTSEILSMVYEISTVLISVVLSGVVAVLIVKKHKRKTVVKA